MNAMTPLEVKVMLKEKGWSNVALATRWRCSAEWVSKVINDPERAPHYDDALRGLPATKSEPRRRFKSKVAGPQGNGKRKSSKKAPGYRYQGTITLGDLLAVDPYFGSVCEEGEHGIVIELVDDGAGESYRTVFPRGDVELLTPDIIDQCFYTNGREDEFAKSYRYTTDAQAALDAQRGRFQF